MVCNANKLSNQMSTEIKCPKCSEVFKIDETGYAELLKQVRNQEFDQEINKRLELAAKFKALEDANNLVEE